MNILQLRDDTCTTSSLLEYQQLTLQNVLGSLYCIPGELVEVREPADSECGVAGVHTGPEVQGEGGGGEVGAQGGEGGGGGWGEV